jgi:signal transduction histidine kinase
MWESSRRQLDDSVKKQAELAAVAFEQWIGAQREPLTTVADYSTEQPINRADFLKGLRFLVDNRSHWIGLRILNEMGDTVIVEPPKAPPLVTGLAGNLLSELQHRAWAIDTDWTRGPDHGMLVLAAPIEDGGAIVAQIDVAAMSQSFFREARQSDQAVVTVFGPQHRILLYRNPAPETYLGADMSSSPFFAALADQESVVIELKSPIDGIERVYGLASAGATGCVVAVGVPSEALYEPARRQLNRYIAFSLLALLCAVAAALIIARGIARPVRLLSGTARRFGKGDLSARASVRAGDEIGELGEAFNAMAAEIEDRTTRLAELDRLKSDFVSGVSHELRTPLTTIKTLTRVLLRSELSDAERREYLETIAAECDRQIDLVLNLLDLSRIESGTFNVVVARVDVAEVINACIMIERHAAEARHHELRAEVPEDIPPALADRVALRRVLCSLIENAIKYTPDGGRITLAASAEGEIVKISISDTGRGITAEDLPHIFEKFYRGRCLAPSASAGSTVEVAEASEVPGVGLGLYLAQTIIEEIGGRISVESHAGRGSTFTIYLPIAICN